MKLSQPPILISACLLGEKVRYDGQHLLLDHPILTKWIKNNQLISICPEVSGGLPIPRQPAEIQKIQSDSIKVININQIDVTEAFQIGAKKALSVCQRNNIRMAILTENSPSCGSSKIYNGSFQGEKISGEGITTKLLRKSGIQVFSQYQLDKADEHYQRLNC